MTAVEVAAAPGTYPVPIGRGRWRVVLHNRMFASTDWRSTIVAELRDAYGRRLDQAWDSAAQFTFTLDGRGTAAALVTELATDVTAWRWDDQTGADVCVFRGIITQAEDQITENSHVVTFTAHDYLAMLARRGTTTTLTYTQTDQDGIAAAFVTLARSVASSSGQSFAPGVFLPIQAIACAPDGSSRSSSAALGAPLRDRTYPASSTLDQMLDDLAKVDSGFDYDLVPAPALPTSQLPAGMDAVRIFYPYQGVQRTDLVFAYGVHLSTVTRSTTSSDYANYWRVVGNNGSSDPAAPQLFAERWNSDANNVTVTPLGLWQSFDNAADVTDVNTLAQKAQGDLNTSGLLVPTYNIGLRPGVYSWGNPRMGESIRLVIISGRLRVDTYVRVMGISYAIGTDGDEVVSLTVGRPTRTLTELLTQADRDVDALTRR